MLPFPLSHQSKRSDDVTVIANIEEELMAKYICPVTRIEMNARQSFVVIRTTGWVVSDRAIREIGIPNLQQEYGPFTADDIIRLVPEEDDEKILRDKMMERRSKAKKEKKRKRAEEGVEDGAGEKESAEEKAARKAAKKAAKAASVPTAEGGKISGAPMGLKVDSLADEAKRAAAKEMEGSSALSSLFSKGEAITDKNRLLSVGRWR